MSYDKSPAFQWYPKDCLTDPVVVAMSMEAECAYRRLIDYCWLDGSLSDSMAVMASLSKVRTAARMARLWTQMVCKFRQREDGRWIHPRLEAERQKQAESRERRQKAADERWSKERASQEKSTCNADAKQCSPSSSPTPSPTPVSTDAPAAVAAVPTRFEEFWDAYPKKRDKGHAEKAFKGLRVSDGLLSIMLSALEHQCRSEDWTKEGGKYIPLAATWLRGHRWDDEIGMGTNTALDRKLGPSYTPGDWWLSCHHEPKCETGPMHRQREAIDGLKVAR